LNSLEARGQTTNDLLVNLFKRYAAASDKTFVDYIARKQERYEEGENISAPQLMNAANEKFKTLKEQSRWNAPSAAEEKILALEAEMTKRIKEIRSKASSSSTKKGQQGKGNKKYPPLPKHLREPPKPGDEKKPVTWNNKTWHWCHSSTGGKCGGKWRLHKPARCRGGAQLKTPTRTSRSTRKH